MVKNIMILSLFVVSWAVSAMERAEKFVDLDCSQSLYSACKGRCYEKTTVFNAVSPFAQKLWAFHDPAIECTSLTFSESLEDLMDNGYNALKAHTCIISSGGVYFSNNLTDNILIANFQLHPDNQVPERTLALFFNHLLSTKGDKIFVWVNEDNGFLKTLLMSKYCFQESWTSLFTPFTRKRLSLPDEKFLQLEADKQAITNLFC